ncbi:hypothetical protein CDD81_3129 [Ophiocordyceps australis]|uniref:NAD-dependent epimerase/dehydratase domain-containing protein n=1 Tax=Ophiocordyceps australis TaxID=1399860 RepID=A0A2C5XXS8_9HYPO|nr:hypothetical protein CDD81_3129 [Ophiocordyceps australis]
MAFDVLVTGSAGHLGKALMLSLPQLGFTPLGVDVLASPTTTQVGSVGDGELMQRLFASNPGIRHVLHGAALHKPHLETHSAQQFVDCNITGTLVLCQAAAAHHEALQAHGGLLSFILFSTTSAFGSAARCSSPGQPVPQVTETTAPVARNMYGLTKNAAEDVCAVVHLDSNMPTLVLRLARFFPEADDDESRRMAFAHADGDANLKVLELAHRRVDIADVVAATVCAMQRAVHLRWAKYIISAPPPFVCSQAVLADLAKCPDAVLRRAVAQVDAVFTSRGWRHLDAVDRVYDSSKALHELGWKPKYTFANVIGMLARGEDWRSHLTIRVGKLGYHQTSTGVYTQR